MRLVFFERDGEACFFCRRPLRWEERGFGWSAHHRRPRGRGVPQRPRDARVVAELHRLTSPANCLILHGSGTTGCHGWAEHERARAIEMGLLISRTATTEEFWPERVPVQRMDGTWWLLTDGGRAVEVDGGMSR
ncbi:hypothetical protein [Microbacterium sp. No. 7]|uniref:hypothetical protein n=1 Tax=Microbacterium sp. No. 7 TaxID=1714373 RepID=UPI0018D1B6CF|nr:hypothetical protein [Microbacterium sp. No. 7]